MKESLFPKFWDPHKTVGTFTYYQTREILSSSGRTPSSIRSEKKTKTRTINLILDQLLIRSISDLYHCFP